jgi:hypothetical protein
MIVTQSVSNRWPHRNGPEPRLDHHSSARADPRRADQKCPVEDPLLIRRFGVQDFSTGCRHDSSASVAIRARWLRKPTHSYPEEPPDAMSSSAAMLLGHSSIVLTADTYTSVLTAEPDMSPLLVVGNRPVIVIYCRTLKSPRRSESTILRYIVGRTCGRRWSSVRSDQSAGVLAVIATASRHGYRASASGHPDCLSPRSLPLPGSQCGVGNGHTIAGLPTTMSFRLAIGH